MLAPAHARQSFNFQNNPGGLNINIFGENRHDASFYIKEQTQKNKFEILVLKTTILGPLKRVFLVFDEKHQQKNFLRVWALIQLKNNRGTNVLLVSIFENTLKKLY